MAATLASTAVYPPDATTFPTTPMPSQSMPGYKQSITDQTFGTTITRVTDQTAFGTTSRILGHEYATMEAWNCDGTMLLITQGQYPNVILDGNTYAILGKYNVPQGASWSHTKPKTMYGLRSNSSTEKDFVSYDVTTNTKTTLRTFSEYTGLRYICEYHISNDDKYTCLFGYKGAGLHLITFDISNKTIIAEKYLGDLQVGDNDPNGVNAIMMSQKGNYVAVVYKNAGTSMTQGVHLYDRNLNYIRFLMNSIGHSDMGLDANGDEIYVGTNNATQRAVFKLRLSDNTKTVVLDDAKMGYNQHTSCRNILRPGWCYISDFEAGYSPRPNEYKLFALKLDGSQTVQFFGWSHRSEVIEYDRAAFICPNPDGSKVVFRSDWGNSANNAIVNGFVATAGSSTQATAPVRTSLAPAVQSQVRYFSPRGIQIPAQTSGLGSSHSVLIKQVRHQNGRFHTLTVAAVR